MQRSVSRTGMTENARIDDKNERSEEGKKSSTTVLAILASVTPSKDVGLAIVDSNIIYTDLRLDLGFAIGQSTEPVRAVCIVVWILIIMRTDRRKIGTCATSTATIDTIQYRQWILMIVKNPKVVL